MITAKSDESPLVSIVVPVYNGERYLRQSLDSILGQTYPNLEVLVMDDASTDSTPTIIASYGARVKCYRQPQNRGQFENVNDGIGMASGEYVAVYHADDVYGRRIVEREVEFLQTHPEAGAVFSLYDFMDCSSKVFGKMEVPREIKGKGLLEYPLVFNTLLSYKNRFICGPSSMVRASVYGDVGPYRGEEFRIASDLEMWVRIARKYPIGILEEHLLSYRSGHGNSSQSYEHLRTESERFFKIMDLYLDEGGSSLADPEALADYEAHRAEDLLMLAVNHYILGQREESQVLLSRLSAGRLLGSRRIQRGRLFILYLAMQALARIPRITPIANLFYLRWHAKGFDGKGRFIRRIFAADSPSIEHAMS